MNLGQSFSRRIRRLLGACLVLTIVMVGCATPATPKIAQGEMPPSGGDHFAQPTVQVLPTQTASLEGQTSWIIQPASTRIPKIAGLNGQLPPHIEQRLSYAFDLAQRGATYTADAEFRAVLGLCALEIDARDGGTNHREAMRQGLIALDEADQFCGDQMNWRDSADVRRVAAGHTTRILSQAPSPVDSIQAVQAYYAFAEQRLAYACDGLPEASMAYYGLAHTIGVPGLRIENASGKAALLHRVALLVAQNLLAANELGVLFAQHGRLNDAEQLFQQCVATDPTPENWRNLAAVYARQGNEQASRAAAASADALAVDPPRQSATRAAEAAHADRVNSGGGTDTTANDSSAIARSNATTMPHTSFR